MDEDIELNRQARELGLTHLVTGRGIMFSSRGPYTYTSSYHHGFFVSWAETTPSGKKRKSRSYKRLADAVASYERHFDKRVVTDPIIRAAHGMQP